MDQDINFQHYVDFASGAGTTTYFQLPYRCTMRELRGIVQADPGDGETVTVTHEPTVGGSSTAIGVMTFGTTISAGAVGAWVADSTDGDKVMEKDEFLKFVPSSGAATATCDLNIELDPYAR